MTTASEVLDFWFGAPAAPEYGKPRAFWFRKDAQFDALVRERFLTLHSAAIGGELDPWTETPEPALALVLLLDQFPRNMFRDTPAAFASDARALAVAERALARGFDLRLIPVQRQFFYLPFEHAEALAAQRRAVALMEPLRAFPETADVHGWALKHLAVVERFGRFPHRNRILGRESTPEEIEFLSQPGSSF